MNKLLVFTNAERWNQIKGEFFVDETQWNIPYNSMAETQVLKYGILNGTAILQPVSNLSIKEAGVYFVYDLISKLVFKQLQEQCADDNLYVLVHTRGVACGDWTKGVHVCEGNHDTLDEHYYYPLFDKLTNVKDSDTEAGKLDEVVELLFKPLKEAALDFINECLVPKSKLEESDAYFTLCQKEEFKPELEAFKKKYEASENYSDYKEDLERLRSILIG